MSSSVIEEAVREAQNILWANLAPTHNVSDEEAVSELGDLVCSPDLVVALDRAPDTALVFVLRAVIHVLAEDDTPKRTISRLWPILDHPDLNGILENPQNSRMKIGRKSRQPNLLPIC